MGRGVEKGEWDSIHVVEVGEGSGGQTTYKLTTTITLSLTVKSATCGGVTLSGNFTRQTEERRAYTDDLSHIGNIGRMIESLESSMRSSMEVVYFDKTMDVMSQIRNATAHGERQGKREMQERIMQGMQGGK
eukprot:TRINITY_DN189_c0_g1_i4.p1 TRINITY_DN189_c0_g1~~TRINITY_DN189_c0_g1_i4.p1  ORF type:complete len:132 (+),score=33.17 TRINITY_DN189_c0_g1_i4:344-739(+)